MAMDYGSGVAPNGATGMGGYAISAAQGTYQQAQNAGLTNIKIGITPMIGKNDVQGEVFRVEDARLLLTFSLANAWVGMISYWSINRDVFNLSGALYQSSQITQNNLDFANILVKFQSSAPTTPVVVTPPATTVPVASGGNMGYVWGKNVFAPYCDVTWNTPFDLVAMAGKSGTARFTLAFIIADNNGKPAWGGYIPLSNNHYWTQISKLRMFGGDVIISFGGAGGTELALVTTNVRTLQGYYQNVLDAYSVSWLDFDVEGGALGNRASIDRRNQAIRALQVAQPALRISYTLPVEPYGLTNDGVYLLESAVKYGVRVDGKVY